MWAIVLTTGIVMAAVGFGLFILGACRLSGEADDRADKTLAEMRRKRT